MLGLERDKESDVIKIDRGPRVTCENDDMWYKIVESIYVIAAAV